MSQEFNIQTMFSQLEVEQFLVYLPGNGWHAAPEVRDDRMRFELPDGDSPYVLLLPTSGRSAQSRRLLQQAIYNLSCIEERQPVEIIRDVIAVETTSGPAPAPRSATRSVRVRVHNADTKPVVMKVAERGDANKLMAGEAREILCQVADDGQIEIRLGGATIEIKS